MIRKEFNKEEGILYTFFEGILQIDEVLNFVKDNNENAANPRDLKILTNALHADLAFTENDLELLNKEIENTSKLYKSVYNAFVVDSPYETALSILHGLAANNEVYQFKVFSTMEEAYKWLKEK